MCTPGFRLLDPQVKTCHFREKIHTSIVSDWIVAHQMPEYFLEEIPHLGVLAYNDDVFLAAGFLRRIERSKDLLLDYFIANPKITGKRRYFALNAVAMNLIEMAEGLKASKILAWTLDTGTFKRAHRLGFQYLPHWGLIYPLKR